MNSSASDDVRIAPATPPERRAALELTFGHLPAEERQRQIDALLPTDPQAAARGAIFAAWRKDRLVGAVAAQLQPGNVAIVWMPQLLPGQPPGTATALLEAIASQLAAHGVCMAQVMLETVTGADTEILQKGGFDHLADLLYLVSPEIEFPAAFPTSPLQFEPYQPSQHGRLAHLVDATYVNSLDCPGLNGIRRIEDVLEGYRRTGVFDPARWLIARHAGEDAGCLLLADHPQHDNYELVYMGVLPSARGHGWGVDMTRHAQWLTRLAGRPRLVLAVDAANQPAIRMYASAGFRAWDRRSVYVRVFAPGRS